MAMVDNVVSFLYPGESTCTIRKPQMLESLPNRFRQIILAIMQKLASLTLGILKSLYPRADLNA
jgi:hypothetical protein